MACQRKSASTKLYGEPFPETQAGDRPTLTEKYNNHVIRQVEKICEVVMQYEFVISQV
jgi:hypothetical protein